MSDPFIALGTVLIGASCVLVAVSVLFYTWMYVTTVVDEFTRFDEMEAAPIVAAILVCAVLGLLCYSVGVML